jgi:sulfonate transport system substrate-binding protein
MSVVHRRTFVAAALAGLAGTAVSFGHLARAQSLKEVRIGWQKAGIFPAVKQRGILEAVFKPLGIEVKWVEFQFGPPLLEALNTGNIDYGYVGDSPPIFAQAASANLLYVAALPASGRNEGIIVPADSPINTLADLKGKKIGVGKASSAHNATIAALEKGGIAYGDVTLAFLPPADALAAFQRRAIDAWTIWDPFLARAEITLKARVVAFARDVHSTSSFYIANRDFTAKNPETVALLNAEFAKASKWGEANRGEIVKSLHESTNVEVEALQHAIDRSWFGVTPVTDEIAARQQIIADRFHKLGLIPKPIAVRDIVWKWKQSA